MGNEVRLIDANAFFDKLEKLAELMKQGKIGEIDLNLLIASMPTVDAVPVVHGRWIPNFEYDFDRGEHRLTGYHCDKCGIWALHKSNYCPNCGAKMDGANEDG